MSENEITFVPKYLFEVGNPPALHTTEEIAYCYNSPNHQHTFIGAGGNLQYWCKYCLVIYESWVHRPLVEQGLATDEIQWQPRIYQFKGIIPLPKSFNHVRIQGVTFQIYYKPHVTKKNPIPPPPKPHTPYTWIVECQHTQFNSLCYPCLSTIIDPLLSKTDPVSFLQAVQSLDLLDPKYLGSSPPSDLNGGKLE